MKILIADSGSTKTDWCLISNGKEQIRIETSGLNPFFLDEEMALLELRTRLLPLLKDNFPDTIHFYGAGCTPEKETIIKQLLFKLFSPQLTLEVASDMLGAARGLCGCRPGIVCILGTGSNSCFYDGVKSAQQVSPLGYILGDEGSGAVLGKLLLGDILKKQLPSAVIAQFWKTYPQLNPALIIDKVYHGSYPNRFLASFSPFLSANLSCPSIRNLVSTSFAAFLERNVMQYNYLSYETSFNGSISFYFKDLMKQECEKRNIRIAKIERTPMAGLTAFHVLNA